jgi:hypothetical protein
VTSGPEGNQALYEDRWITVTPAALTIRGYYFPLGSARSIPIGRIHWVQKVAIGKFTGQWRIWGTANPKYWLSLDPRRPRKKVALVLDLGGQLRPVITPDDPDVMLKVLDDLGVPNAGEAAKNPPIQGKFLTL